LTTPLLGVFAQAFFKRLVIKLSQKKLAKQ